MRICFVSMSAYPLLVKKNFGSAGGAEVQLVSLAEQLSLNGYDVSFVTFDYGQQYVTNVKKIKIMKSYPCYNALRANSFTKFYHITRALEKLNSDVYVCSADSHGILPLFAFIRRTNFIYRIPSDKVVLNEAKSFKIRLAELIDIKRANVVVAQSIFQQRKLKEIFGVDSVVIRNSLSVPNVKPEKPNPPMILWVGSISHVKQPHLFIELAKAIPDASFHMVGGRGMCEPQLYDDIADMAMHQSNVHFHGFVPYHEITKYFGSASIFVNTSRLEGFPNTFLQAWAHYVPVISLNVDPDGIMHENKLGFCSKTFDQLVSDVRVLLENNEQRKKMGCNARNYVEKEHNILTMTKKYMRLFDFFDK